MAKLTDQTKTKLIADYHTNKYSQRELAKKYDVSLGTVSKLTKEIKPQNEHLVNAQVAVLEGHSKLPNEQMNAIMNTANDEIRRKSLVFGVIEKALKLNEDMLDANKTFEKINKGDGIQDFEPRELNTTDIKNIIESTDKASITLKVNERFSSSTNVAIQNNQQKNINVDIVGYGVKTIEN